MSESHSEAWGRRGTRTISFQFRVVDVLLDGGGVVHRIRIHRCVVADVGGDAVLLADVSVDGDDGDDDGVYDDALLRVDCGARAVVGRDQRTRSDVVGRTRCRNVRRPPCSSGR